MAFRPSVYAQPLISAGRHSASPLLRAEPPPVNANSNEGTEDLQDETFFVSCDRCGCICFLSGLGFMSRYGGDSRTRG